MDGNISFDSNSLQTYSRSTGIGIITDDIDLDSLADKVLNVLGLAHQNASTIPFINYPSKTIPVTGTIASTSATALDTLLDTFRGYLTGKDKNLDIVYKGSTRRFIATVSGLTIKRSENKKYARFAINFFCTIPFGVNTTDTTALSATGRTLASYTDAHTFLGNAPYQLPVATITLTAVSSTGSQQLFWGNADTGQGITITRSNWTAGDVIVIDVASPSRPVTVNGVAVDFVGAFPEFTPGAHNMNYADSFTSRTFSISVLYKPRWA
ncbi:phage distal tail protein [Polynucleobacter sp.]|jgi:hypothetical protein|uniref:phage distal tail protein n=1 Tax=Polynucleobacter sp. TaxID=2029855 RepID=UPI003F6955B6